jgi:hypothetical protein
MNEHIIMVCVDWNGQLITLKAPDQQEAERLCRALKNNLSGFQYAEVFSQGNKTFHFI